MICELGLKPAMPYVVYGLLKELPTAMFCHVLASVRLFLGPVLEPGGRTAFRSHSNSSVLTHPAQREAVLP